MTKSIVKSLLCGFILGCILFAIAPLGLGVYFIEQLKPALVPGVYLCRFMIGNSTGFNTILLSLFLNGIIYSIPFLVISLAKLNNQDR